VLLGTRRFGVLGAWWEFSEGRSGCGSSFYFRQSAGLGIVFFSFSLFFLLGLLVLMAPAVRCIVWLLY
jgi:hypothetical protein